jgi:hypothetical protein
MSVTQHNVNVIIFFLLSGMVEGVVDCSTGRCLPTGDVKKVLAKAAEGMLRVLHFFTFLYFYSCICMIN